MFRKVLSDAPTCALCGIYRATGEATVTCTRLWLKGQRPFPVERVPSCETCATEYADGVHDPRFSRGFDFSARTVRENRTGLWSHLIET